MSSRRFPRSASLLRYGPSIPVFNILVIVLAFGLLAAPAPAAAGEPVILALGDSLTAGYGVAPRDAFPVQLEAALRRARVPARVINGGVSGDTSAGGLARIDWLLEEIPDLAIIELGANDGLRGLDPAVTSDNLDRIIVRFRDAGVHVLLTGMRAPPNLGAEYGAAFDAMFGELARRHDTAFYPFFLDGVAGKPTLNQADGIHPTAEGVAVIVGNMLPVVVGALQEARR
ncbi:MAG: arylesterase [Alphaproteobacteria bacterium]